MSRDMRRELMDERRVRSILYPRRLENVTPFAIRCKAFTRRKKGNA